MGEACVMPKADSAKNTYFRRSIEGCGQRARRKEGTTRVRSRKPRIESMWCPYCSNVLLADLLVLGQASVIVFKSMARGYKCG
jgi:hypothetical protein